MTGADLEAALAEHDAYHDGLAMESIEDQDYRDFEVQCAADQYAAWAKTRRYWLTSWVTGVAPEQT